MTDCRNLRNSGLLLVVVFLTLVATGSSLTAQSLRYDLGQRLRRFEVELQRDLSIEQRKKVLPPMKLAVQSFFGGKFTDAAEQLDDAWIQLLPEKQQAMAKWVASRHVVAKSLLAGERFEFQLQRRYGGPVKSPAEYEVVCEVIANLKGQASLEVGAETRFSNVDKACSILIPAEGQYLVRIGLESSGFSIPIGEVIVVRTSDFQNRVAALQTATQENKATWNKSARSTIRQQAKWLANWATSNDAETNVPALQELNRLESMAKHADKDNWLSLAIADSVLERKANPLYSNSFWLSVVGDGRKSARLRVRLPERATKSEVQKSPCVFALHGAGGSENMMFDAYGAGRIVDLCSERGWILIAPNLQRTGLAIPDIVDELEKQLPIDRDRIFILGHSMGAGFAMREVKLAQARSPRFLFKAVSPIGGGQAMVIPDRADDLPLTTPFFVAAGSDDFGKSGASSLHRSLKRQSLDSKYKEYEETEHMAIVQVALEDVFKFFDESASKK